MIELYRAALRPHRVLDPGQALAATPGPAVVLLVDWTPADATALARHAVTSPGVLHLPIRFDGALTLLGPVQRPGAVGCLHCAERQRLAVTGKATPWRDPRLRLAGLASPMLVDGIAALVDDV